MRAQSARTTGYGSRACREQSKQYMNSPVYEQPAAPSLAKKTPRSRSRVSTYSSGCGTKITNRARRNQRQMGASRPSVVDHPNDERSTDHGREERSRFFEERKLGSVSLSLGLNEAFQIACCHLVPKCHSIDAYFPYYCYQEILGV
jgi:hypothetical protein